ncbi:very-short-patch-repair endonuclease [Anaerotaenia torta]|uniref:AbiJ-related protein n=1 Tax=Anaerotaenia torta TaxID=433293 RepID=UPI003D20569F
MANFKDSKENHFIIDETRRSIVDAILAMGSLTGDKQYHEFAKVVCPSLTEDMISEIARHMDRFDDWPESYLLDTIIDYMNLSDEEFMFFLEQYTNPNIHHWHWNAQEERREDVCNSGFVDVINRYLEHDGYKLVVKDTIGDKQFYQCVSTKAGVRGSVKNIIFAAKYKPEIVFDDALNNDIRITKNANQCLIYDRPIPQNGLMWGELVEWYAEENVIEDNQENMFIRRLCDCLDTSFKASGEKSGPETWMLQAYYELKNELSVDVPALIPQVYLYYDPQTQKERGYKLFEHQKMDFLMIFSHRDRVVIEIDGKQHYADGDRASPKLYSEMVKAHREMSLFGYDVYRFGGYEFLGANDSGELKQKVLNDLKRFFVNLFRKYGVVTAL